MGTQPSKSLIIDITKSEPSAIPFSNGFPKRLIKKGMASVPEIRVDLLDQANFPLWLAAIKSSENPLRLGTHKNSSYILASAP